MVVEDGGHGGKPSGHGKNLTVAEEVSRLGCEYFSLRPAFSGSQAVNRPAPGTDGGQSNGRRSDKENRSKPSHASSCGAGSEAAMRNGYACPLCSKSFAKVADVEAHVTAWHSEELDDPNRGNPPACSEGARTAERIMDRTLKCPLCDARDFDTADALALHVNTAHFPDELSASAEPDAQIVAGKPGPRPARGVDETRVAMGFSDTDESLGKRRKLSGERTGEQAPVQKRIDGSFSGTTVKETVSSSVVAPIQDRRVRQAINSLQYHRREYMQKQLKAGSLSYGDYHWEMKMADRTDEMGLDDGSSRTFGVVDAIGSLAQILPEVKQVKVARRPDHFAVNFYDQGWGCGYRNIQMMWSSLNNIPSFRPALVAGMLQVPRPLGGGLAGNPVPDDAVPSVIHVAELIEAAWRNGFDVDGGNQLGMNLVGNKTWIGATEAYALFSFLGVKCRLYDFWRATGPSGTHPLLFRHIEDYFANTPDPKPPLFLQEHGHSVTIAGFVRCIPGSFGRPADSYAVVLDPGHKQMDRTRAAVRLMEEFKGSQGLARNKAAVGTDESDEKIKKLRDAVKPFLRDSGSFIAAQYQILACERPVNSPEEQLGQMVVKSQRVP